MSAASSAIPTLSRRAATSGSSTASAAASARPACARSTRARPTSFHAVLGSLDGVPAGGAVDSAHVSFALPPAAAGGVVAVEVRHAFSGVQRVEGIALVGDETHYVVDEDGALGIRTLLLSDP